MKNTHQTQDTELEYVAISEEQEQLEEVIKLFISKTDSIYHLTTVRLMLYNSLYGMEERNR